MALDLQMFHADQFHVVSIMESFGNPPIHVRNIRPIENREETDDARGQHVQQRNDVQRDPPATERPTSRRQRLAVAAAPEHTADAQSVGQPQCTGEQADDGVEDLPAAEVQKRDDHANA